MSLISDKEEACREAINTYLEQNVLYESASEFRVSSRLTPLSDSAFDTTFTLPDEIVSLPTSEKYYVYYLYAEDFKILSTIKTNTWYNTKNLAEQYYSLIHVYGTNGRMMAKSGVYFRLNTEKNVAFIAINENIAIKCVNYTTDSKDVIKCIDDLTTTIHYNTNNINKITIYSKPIKDLYNIKHKREVLTEISTFLSQCTSLTYLSIYRGGYEVTPTDKIEFTDLDDNTYLDIIIDPNIDFMFDVDLMIKNCDDFHLTDGAYHSIKDRTWKELIHIPRECNPDNKIITHHTIELFIRSKSRSKPYGLYVHRSVTNNSTLSQISHNDFGAPLGTLRSYQNYLPDDELYMHFVVRKRREYHYLNNEASFINYIYALDHSDNDIIDILCERKASSLLWWRAEQLERKPFLTYLSDLPNITRKDLMIDYIDALGYYKVLSILGGNVITTTISSNIFSINLPYLYQDIDVLCEVYLNGIHIPVSNTSSNKNGSTLNITLNNTTVEENTTAVILLFADGVKVNKCFTPSIKTTTEGEESVSESYLDTEIATNDVKVYKVIRNEELNTSYIGNTSLVNLYDTPTNDITLQRVTSGYTVADGKITFEDTGNTYWITSTFASYKVTYDLGTYADVSNSIPLRIELTENIKPKSSSTTDTTTNETTTTTPEYVTVSHVPILDYDSLFVYLNNKYLVRDIDYTVTIEQNENGIMYHAVHITNTDYRNASNNTVDIIANRNKILQHTTGYTDENKIITNPKIYPYSKEISTVHVNGVLEMDTHVAGSYLSLPEGKYPDESRYELQVTIPESVTSYISSFATGTDASRISAMNNYFE